MRLRNFFISASLCVFGPLAISCEWSGIPEIRGSRSPNQTIAMCKLIPACLEKYQANEQCKKDWYEQRRLGDTTTRKKRGKIIEYQEFNNRLNQVNIK